MSAQRLRDAAKVLRERAKAATKDRHGGTAWMVDPDWPDFVLAPDDPTGWDGTEVTHARKEADAAFIATMHPGVALALADWLDYAARNLPACDCHWPDEPFRVADLILGTQS